MLHLLTARPPGPSAAAYCSDELHASTWSELPSCAGSLHAPPRGFPQPPAARLPRASRRSRAAVAQQPTAPQHIATVPVALLPAQRLCENQAAQPRPTQSHARPSYVGPGTQSCAASPGALCTVSLAAELLRETALRNMKNREQLADSLFRSTRRDFTYAVQGLLVRSSLRSTLSRSGVISLGSSKKYSGGYEAFFAS
jgi:hypothetical protein